MLRNLLHKIHPQKLFLFSVCFNGYQAPHTLTHTHFNHDHVGPYGGYAMTHRYQTASVDVLHGYLARGNGSMLRRRFCKIPIAFISFVNNFELLSNPFGCGRSTKLPPGVNLRFTNQPTRIFAFARRVLELLSVCLK